MVEKCSDRCHYVLKFNFLFRILIIILRTCLIALIIPIKFVKLLTSAFGYILEISENRKMLKIVMKEYEINYLLQMSLEIL